MAVINSIFENNAQWIQQKLAADPEYFHKLNLGQAPEYLYIGCSDSRVTAEEIMGLAPGEVFVHRNIANLVVNNDLNGQAVIHFAVRHLKVKHIIISGHYNCGGVKASMQPDDLGILNPWLRNIRDVYRMYQEELDAIEDYTERNDRLVELNVIEQVTNVLKLKVVQQARKERDIQIHGWIFDFKTGKLKNMDIDIEKIERDLHRIYELK